MYPYEAGCNLICACGEANRFDDALHVFEKMLTSLDQSKIQPKVRIYNTMIKTCEQGGWFTYAIWILNRMREDKDVSPNADSYFAVIAACQQGAESPQKMIKELIDDAIAKGVFQEALGYSAADGAVSFCNDAIVVKQAEGAPSYVKLPYVAQALFEYHRLQGRIVKRNKLVFPSDAREVAPTVMQLIKNIGLGGYTENLVMH
jgi:pentatricopeptide repeat protein